MKIVISSIHGNDDDIILVLGALARHSNLTIQKIIVDELLRRLHIALSMNDNEAVTTLIYALGNSGSKLAIFSLLSTLQYNDIKIQIATIASLASHLDQPVVQQAIITFLPLTNEDKILEEILKILIDAYENKVLKYPSKELVSTVIKSTMQFENPILYGLTAKYLHYLKLDGVDVYLDLLKQHGNQETQHNHFSDLYKNNFRAKRGSDWDEDHPDFDVVDSLSQRKSDVINYPYHKAYIWARTFGEDNLNMMVGAGAFGGININWENAGYKIFAKAVAKVNVFGITFDVVNIEASSYTSGQTLIYKLYFKLGFHVYKNENKKIDLAINLIQYTTSIDKSRTVFYTKWPIFVYVGTVNVYIEGKVSFQMNADVSASLAIPPPTAKCVASAKISISLKVTGGAYVSFLVCM